MLKPKNMYNQFYNYELKTHKIEHPAGWLILCSASGATVLSARRYAISYFI